MKDWTGWYSGASSSDDEDLFTPVKLKKRGRMTLPMTVQEIHERAVLMGEEYKQRKLDRRCRREAARQKLEEPLPQKYFSDNEEEAQFSDDADVVHLDRDLANEKSGWSSAASSSEGEFEFEFPSPKGKQKKQRTMKSFKLDAKKKAAKKASKRRSLEEDDLPLASLRKAPRAAAAKGPPKKAAAKEQPKKAAGTTPAVQPNKRRVTAEFRLPDLPPPRVARKPLQLSDSSESDSEASLTDLGAIAEFHQSDRVNCFYCLEFFCASSFHWVKRKDLLAESTRFALINKADSDSNREIQDAIRAKFTQSYERKQGCKATQPGSGHRAVPLCVDAKLHRRFPISCVHCSSSPCVFHEIHPELVATTTIMLRNRISANRVRTYVYGAFSEILKLPLTELPACLALHGMRYYANRRAAETGVGVN